MDDETEEVLEIGEPARRWRREVLADVVLAQALAEAVAKVQPMGEPEIDADVRAKEGPGSREGCGWQWRHSTRGQQPGLGAGQMQNAAACAEIRANATTAPPEVNQEIEYCGVLRAGTRLLIEGV